MQPQKTYCIFILYYIRIQQWDAISWPYHNFNGGFAQLFHNAKVLNVIKLNHR